MRETDFVTNQSKLEVMQYKSNFSLEDKTFIAIHATEWLNGMDGVTMDDVRRPYLEAYGNCDYAIIGKLRNERCESIGDIREIFGIVNAFVRTNTGIPEEQMKEALTAIMTKVIPFKLKGQTISFYLKHPIVSAGDEDNLRFRAELFCMLYEMIMENIRDLCFELVGETVALIRLFFMNLRCTGIPEEATAFVRYVSYTTPSLTTIFAKAIKDIYEQDGDFFSIVKDIQFANPVNLSFLYDSVNGSRLKMLYTKDKISEEKNDILYFGDNVLPTSTGLGAFITEINKIDEETIKDFLVLDEGEGITFDINSNDLTYLKEEYNISVGELLGKDGYHRTVATTPATEAIFVLFSTTQTNKVYGISICNPHDGKRRLCSFYIDPKVHFRLVANMNTEGNE